MVHDSFDPEAFMIKRDTAVWVARPNEHFPMRLYYHRMKNDMIFRGYPETIMSPDPRLPRIISGPLVAKPTIYCGYMLRFCTLVDHGQNRVGKVILELGLDPIEFTSEQLSKVCYNTFWTGKKSWPFIISESYSMADGTFQPPKY